MVDLNSVLAEIEQDLSWRQDELAFFENDLTATTNESHQKLKTKPLILLLYAHFEGHAKLMLLKYASEINNLNLDCSGTVPNLVASTLDPIFGALKNPDKAHPIFKKEYDPDFKELCRRTEFLEVLNQIMTTKISLKVDKIVDVESNLKPPVLKKIFYRLGIQHDCISDRDLGNLATLLGYRNNIAHGSKKDGMPIVDYYKIKTSISSLLNLIKAQVISHLSQKKYELPLTS